MKRKAIPSPLVRLFVDNDYTVHVLGSEGLQDLAATRNEPCVIAGLAPEKMDGLHLASLLEQLIKASLPDNAQPEKFGYEYYPSWCRVVAVTDDDRLGMRVKVTWKRQGTPISELHLGYNPKMEGDAARFVILPAVGFTCRYCDTTFEYLEDEEPGSRDACEICEQVAARVLAEHTARQANQLQSPAKVTALPEAPVVMASTEVNVTDEATELAVAA